MVRNYCECYNTAGIIPTIKPGMSIRERAHATVEAGYRAFRMGAADAGGSSTYNTRERLNQVLKDCQQAREGVGENGDFCIDFHQRFDLAEAIRGCTPIESLRSRFSWKRSGAHRKAFQPGPAYSETLGEGTYRGGRGVGKTGGISTGWWEEHDIDFLRATLPGVRRHHRRW